MRLGLREDGCDDAAEAWSALVGLVEVDMDDVDGRPCSSVTAAEAGESELAGAARVSGAGKGVAWASLSADRRELARRLPKTEPRDHPPVDSDAAELDLFREADLASPDPLLVSLLFELLLL